MNVPYVNQLDNAPRGNDCGPACAAMLAGSVKPALATSQTVTDLSVRFDALQDGTTAADLLRMGEHLGVPMRATKTAEYPYIALVDYRALPVRYQAGGDFGHWIVRLSPNTYHDPLWRGDAGASLVAAAGELDAAEQAAKRWSSIVPNRVTLKTMANTTQGIITASERFRVRNAPSMSTASVSGFWLLPGQIFEIADVVQAEGWGWAKIVVSTGSVSNGFGYVRSDGWRFVRQPPIPVPPQPPTPQPADWKHAKHLLGVNCLNDGGAGMDALARGCRSVLFMDNLMGAAAAARQYPDALIKARFWFQNAPDPSFLADHAGAGLTDIPNNMWTTCCNESDWFGYGSPDELRRRFEYERAFCNSMWARNPQRRIVIGEFSHGTPDITNPAIVQTFKDTYYAFALANTGRVRIGWHLYTKGRRFPDAPPQGADIVAPEWFEGRDASFWRQCGADARVIHTCGETGVEAGAGGFTWAGYSDDDFAKWCSWWLEYRRSLSVVMEAACIFQVGSHPNWQGYNVQRYLPVLADFWQGKRS